MEFNNKIEVPPEYSNWYNSLPKDHEARAVTCEIAYLWSKLHDEALRNYEALEERTVADSVRDLLFGLADRGMELVREISGVREVAAKKLQVFTNTLRLAAASILGKEQRNYMLELRNLGISESELETFTNELSEAMKYRDDETIGRVTTALRRLGEVLPRNQEDAVILIQNETGFDEQQAMSVLTVFESTIRIGVQIAKKSKQ